MANRVVLEPSAVPMEAEEVVTPLLKENFLGEFVNDDEKSTVRSNLKVYSQEETYTKEEANRYVTQELTRVLAGYVPTEDLTQAIQDALQTVEDELYVKSDGSVPFTNPQSHPSMPTEGSHLTNKTYVDNSMTAHLSASDPHKTLEQIQKILADYAKVADVYNKRSTYSKNEVQALVGKYVRADGSTPFTAPQSGAEPTLPGHLSTRRYVNQVMEDHKAEIDPHDFLATLKRYLSNYYTKSETYTKAQTYSRAQLLDIIQGQMKGVVDQALATYEAQHGSVDEVRDFVERELAECIKADGSVTHYRPQAGMPAENDNEFVVLSQLEERLQTLDDTLQALVKDSTNQSTWITSGPVRSTVGFVEDNTVMPREMTVQQICDAIFYGRQIGVEAPPYAEFGEKVCIKIYTHGLGLLESVDIYKNGELAGTLTSEDFTEDSGGFGDDGAWYEFCDPDLFTEDTEWKVKFHYSSGEEIEDKAETKLSYPIFIGALPHFWNAEEDVTFKNLRAKALEDPVNCRFFTHLGPEISTLEMKFKFEDVRTRDIVVVIPQEYPDLLSIATPVQKVEEDACGVTVQPLHPHEDEGSGIVYKIYVFNQALVRLDEVVRFTFGKEEEEEYE